MDQVSVVATWVGLFTGVAGIVLSVVAIWFSTNVDKRSRETNDQTIQSMQRIEGYVDRISGDVGGLIRAAWDRMLGNVGKEMADNQTSEDSTRAIAAGLAAELRAELLGGEPDGSPENRDNDDQRENEAQVGNLDRKESTDQIVQLNKIIQRLESSFENQLRSLNATPGGSIDLVQGLSPAALSLLKALAETRGHLERDEYMHLRRHPLARRALTELRHSGLVVALAGGDEEPVYWIPMNRLSQVGAGLMLAPAESVRIRNIIRSALDEVGYFKRIASYREAREPHGPLPTTSPAVDSEEPLF